MRVWSLSEIFYRRSSRPVTIGEQKCVFRYPQHCSSPWLRLTYSWRHQPILETLASHFISKLESIRHSLVDTVPWMYRQTMSLTPLKMTVTWNRGEQMICTCSRARVLKINIPCLEIKSMMYWRWNAYYPEYDCHFARSGMNGQWLSHRYS